VDPSYKLWGLQTTNNHMNNDSINIVLIDSFDSFTINLKACILSEKNINLETIQYNQISDHTDKIIQSDGIVISPGQGDPLSYVQYHKPLLNTILKNLYSGSVWDIRFLRYFLEEKPTI
jgi:carbamoylphosphate synthase small subunit